MKITFFMSPEALKKFLNHEKAAIFSTELSKETITNELVNDQNKGRNRLISVTIEPEKVEFSTDGPLDYVTWKSDEHS